MESFPDYLQSQMDKHGWLKAELARASGVHSTAIGRWLTGESTPGIGNARDIARALGRPLLEVLVAAGHLTPEEAKQRTAVPPSPSELTDDQLLAEVGRRMRRGDSIAAEDARRDPDRYTPAGAANGRRTGARAAK